MQNKSGVYEEADVCKNRKVDHIFTMIPISHSQDYVFELPTLTITRSSNESKSATPLKVAIKSYARISVKAPCSARKTPNGAVKRKKSAKRSMKCIIV